MARTTRRQDARQHHKRRSSRAHAAPWEPRHFHAAGIAMGADAHWVAVPPDRNEQSVQRFGALTADL